MWKSLSFLEGGHCEVDQCIHISWLLHIHNSISCAHQLITHSLTNQAQFNILLPSTPRFRCQPIPSSFPITLYTCYVSSESYLPTFNRLPHVWWRVQTAKLPNTQFSPVSYFSLALGPKYLPHHRLFFPLNQKTSWRSTSRRSRQCGIALTVLLFVGTRHSAFSQWRCWRFNDVSLGK
jgi:hypothetical protein